VANSDTSTGVQGSRFACPHCSHEFSGVKDSRPNADGIRRRRICLGCEARFTTYERVHIRDLTAIKRGGRRQPFDRDKLERSIRLACARLELAETPEILAGKIAQRLENMGDPEVTTREIGRVTMEVLKHTDPVAYTRYASVYLEFEQATDFTDFLRQEALT
jgi:transcriptional repressor NrdR